MKNPLTAGQPAQEQRQQGQPDINALFQQFKQNPVKYLTGMDIPAGMNNPEQIVRHLAQCGKIPPMLQGRVNAMLNARVR